MNNRKTSPDKLVYIVTTECPGVTPSGGIGSQVLELSTTLGKSGVAHRILIIAPEIHREKANAVDNVEFISASDFTDVGDVPKGVSYAAFKYLSRLKPKKVIFPDYLGLGFHSMLAKSQGLAFHHTELLVAVHGPTRWALEQNHAFFSDPAQLAVDWMEMQSLILSDTIVYLSAYIKSWCENAWPGLRLHPRTRLACNPITFSAPQARTEKPGNGRRRINRIVFFGRHEYRKNISDFLAALKLGHKENPELFQNFQVSFLGAFSEMDRIPSELFIYENTKDLPLNVSFMPDCGRHEAMQLLASWPDCLVIIPSVENCPYTVLETLGASLPVMVNGNGGSKELIDEPYRESCVFNDGARDLAAKMQRALSQGLKVPKASQFVKNAPAVWKTLATAPFARELAVQKKTQPLVSLVVCTYNRPEKAIEAIKSGLQQTYQNVEIVLVDDGSDALNPAHKIMIDFVKNHGVNYIYQQNRYLGAARNTGTKAAKGSYIIHLDDDDLLVPNAIETLLDSALTAKLDVVVATSVYMNEHERPILEEIGPIASKPAYLPLGGPISLSFIENCIGPAVSLISRSVFDRVTYTELYGVGHEDYEFYVNVIQAGFKLQICPEPVFLYEVGRPSMINVTPVRRNFFRSSSACSLPGTAGKDLSSILLSRQVDSVADSRSMVNHIKDERFRALYKNISRVDQTTRLKIFYQYVKACNDTNYKRMVAHSLLRRSTAAELLASGGAESQLALKRRSQLIAAQAAAGVVKTEKMRSDLQRLLDEGRAMPTADLNNLFKVLARTRSWGISQAICELSGKLKIAISDERKFLSLMAVASYLCERREEFNQYFLPLFTGESNDFRSGEKYAGYTPVEVYKDVFDPRNHPPVWAFSNTRLLASIIGACTGERVIAAVEALYAFATAPQKAGEAVSKAVEDSALQPA